MKRSLKYFFLKRLRQYASKWFVLVVDLSLLSFAFIFAYLIKSDVSFNFNIAKVLAQLPVVLLTGILSFLLVGSYKGIIRHTGTKDAVNVFLGVSIFSFILGSGVLMNRSLNFFPQFNISWTIILTHYLVSVVLLILSRFVFKAAYEVISSDLEAHINVLIYGAGDTGMITYSVLNRDRKNNYNVVGFVDDNPKKINKKIDRVKINDPKKIDKNFIKKYDVKEMIISTSKIKSTQLLELTDKFLDFDVKIKIIPPLTQWIEGDLQANEIKQVKIDDLLGRDQINLEDSNIKAKVTNKTIIVTGAAGSIGSEISRQLAVYNLEKLILIDQSESALYDLQQELHQDYQADFVALVADVRDARRMREVFEQYRPEKVYHAAAYKHVPLMEESPYEAIKINVLGTKNIADLALEYQVERFVMVSTDKAVNPTNVMGATKRLAEMYISCLSRESVHTKFTTTRFGNVLGSNGSVIPLFKRQINNGGPLTLTHKDITRYFMTIPEACQLVLEAGTMGEGGEIYIFDMGKSIKIYDMAKRMIALSGLKYPEDIDIKITGLRPGEKLYEELLANDENVIKTYHKKIMIAKAQEVKDCTFMDKINVLESEFTQCNSLELVSLLKAMVPEYISKNSKFETLDRKTVKV